MRGESHMPVALLPADCDHAGVIHPCPLKVFLVHIEPERLQLCRTRIMPQPAVVRQLYGRRSPPQMDASDPWLLVEIGERAGNLQHPVIAPRRKFQLFRASRSNCRPPASGSASFSIRSVVALALVVRWPLPTFSKRSCWSSRARATRSGDVRRSFLHSAGGSGRWRKRRARRCGCRCGPSAARKSFPDSRSCSAAPGCRYGRVRLPCRNGRDSSPPPAWISAG